MEKIVLGVYVTPSCDVLEYLHMKSMNILRYVVAGLLVLALLAGGNVALKRYDALVEELLVTKVTLSTNQKTYEGRIAQLEASSTELHSALASSSMKNQDLSGRLGLVLEDNSNLTHRVVATEGQLGVLDKLRKLDKELLQKYSKVYFLNENYVPSSLATITPEFSYDKKKILRFHTDALPSLLRLLTDASSSGNTLALVSTYRSFKEQAILKNQYTITYGKGANSFSADQGYSEHQLGTTVDFTTLALGNNFTNFDKSNGYIWLMQNGWKYGFIQSYPKNNTYYVYEPWHWRFVGVVLSARLHQDGKNFYDLQQRDIDGYLIDIFD